MYSDRELVLSLLKCSVAHLMILVAEFMNQCMQGLLVWLRLPVLRRFVTELEYVFVSFIDGRTTFLLQLLFLFSVS